MSHERNEPAELRGLRDQVTEAKERPLELRRKRSKKNMPRERERHGHAPQREPPKSSDFKAQSNTV